MRLAGSRPTASISPVRIPSRSSATSPPIGVAIVEDDAAMRDGLAALVAGTPGLSCVGRYGSVEDLLRRSGGESANVVLLDIHLPGISGSEGVRLVRERWPSTEVLMLTVFADEQRIFESICNGAVGYLLKKTPPTRLVEAIHEAAGGGAPMSPEIARKVVALFRRVPRAAPQEEALTPQELRLLQLLSDGHSYKAAGGSLGITVNTVRGYIRNIYEKLHVHSKSEAVGKALRSGLIQ